MSPGLAMGTDSFVAPRDFQQGKHRYAAGRTHPAEGAGLRLREGRHSGNTDLRTNHTAGHAFVTYDKKGTRGDDGETRGRSKGPRDEPGCGHGGLEPPRGQAPSCRFAARIKEDRFKTGPSGKGGKSGAGGACTRGGGTTILTLARLAGKLSCGRGCKLGAGKLVC